MSNTDAFDEVSYIMGFTKGKSDGQSDVVITGAINCADDGNGNITITEEN